MYVQTILDVHKKYNALVMSAFNNDAGFVAALDKVTLSLKIFENNLKKLFSFNNLWCILNVCETDLFVIS